MRDEIAADRIASIDGSIELSKMRLQNLINPCDENVSRILASKSGKEEAFYWIKLAEMFIDDREYDLKIVQKKLSVNLTDQEEEFLSRTWAGYILRGALTNAKYSLSE